MYIHICVQTLLSVQSFIHANTHLISLSTSCPYPLTIQIYEEKKIPDQFLPNGETAT